MRAGELEREEVKTLAESLIAPVDEAGRRRELSAVELGEIMQLMDRDDSGAACFAGRVVAFCARGPTPPPAILAPSAPVRHGALPRDAIDQGRWTLVSSTSGTRPTCGSGARARRWPPRWPRSR
eukprot:COSAG01_NODE_1260_length_11008_cov_96.487208_2_plen_124_part_00